MSELYKAMARDISLNSVLEAENGAGKVLSFAFITKGEDLRPSYPRGGRSSVGEL